MLHMVVLQSPGNTLGLRRKVDAAAGGHATYLAGFTIVFNHLHALPSFLSRGHVREYHYVLKMASHHFQHMLFFMIDIFSTCRF